MSSETTWTSIENAVATYCLETPLILKWVDDGSICAEHHDTRAMRVKVDDLIQKIHHVKKSKPEFLDCD
ncbi:MAG TPA: MerR family transcriptional regulator [Desulfuromonadales bacterium]|nr:MerR family transcriptional regulator [Desulfuromonadales bacterium]